MTRRFLFWLAVAVPLSAQTDAARAVLEKRCLACHGQARTSGLDLRSLESAQKGGKRGPAIVPGRAAESLLLRAVQRDGDLKMPPGAPLPAEEVAALRAWIDSGAPWPKTAIGEPAWWSFRKIARPPVPSVASAEWSRNPVDAFVFQTLAQRAQTGEPGGPAHLDPARVLSISRPAACARRGRCVRPGRSPDAYEKLIDRLLASPRYGERWGRHWLDVVRYADTGGFETDMYYANAWRYRDYVIKSFNDDKPYDRFVQEQIAGDEIWPDNMELHGSYDIPAEKQGHLEARIGTDCTPSGPLITRRR